MAYISDIAFVDTDFIKKYSTLPIPEELDDIYLSNSILQAQNEHVQKVLGSPLYTEVCTQLLAFVSGSTPMNPQYRGLLDTFLQPLTMYYSLWTAAESLEFKVMNTSIVVKVDATNAKQITDQQLNNLKRILIRNVEYWTDSTIRYITTQNTNLQWFPEWTNFTVNPDTILPQRGPGYGKTGFYFKKRKPGNFYYGPYDAFDKGTTGYGWNIERGSADADICCR
jgi:hypothetical protein